MPASSVRLVVALAVRPTGPAAALASPPISSLSSSSPFSASSFMKRRMRSVFDAPICGPMLAPASLKKAGALQPLARDRAVGRAHRLLEGVRGRLGLLPRLLLLLRAGVGRRARGDALP